MPGIAPDRILFRVLTVGVASLVANPEPLDDIWDDTPTAERERLIAYFASNPPNVRIGYPRMDGPFPVFAITMQGDNEHDKFIGESEIAVLGDDDIKTGDERFVRRIESLGVFIIGHNSEVIAAYYRVAKRIVEVAMPYFVRAGLDLTTVSGAELAPDQKADSEQLFGRRLTASFEYFDQWPTNDSLWEAVNGDAEAFITDPQKVDAFGPGVHFVDDDDEFGNTVIGYEEDGE